MKQTKRQSQARTNHDPKTLKSTDPSNTLLRNSTRFYLEDLSNEIIYEIFEYLDFCHLHEAFFNLNRRFQHLVNNTILPIKINLSSISKSTFQHYYTHVILPYQHQIKALHLSNPFIIEHVFSLSSIALKLTRLEQLHLENCDRTFLKQLLVHLVSFPRLSSLTISDEDVDEFPGIRFHHITHLPVLKYCKLPSLFQHTWQPLSTSIEYLIITHRFHLRQLNTLLLYVPALRHLSLYNLYQYANDQTEVNPTMLNYLTHVSLNIMGINFDTLELLIMNLSDHIQVLHISVENELTFMNANRWEQLIVSHMPHLRIFDLLYHHHFVWPDHITSFISLVDQFHSSYWLEKKWFFKYYIYDNVFSHTLIFYSRNSHKRKQYTIRKISDGNIDLNDTVTNINSIDHLEIANEDAMIQSTHYFPTATQLTMSYRHTDQSKHFLPNILRYILPLKQLTKLVITYYDDDFTKIIDLLRCASNLHTFGISSKSLNNTPSALTQRSDIFRIVSKTNHIRTIILTSSWNLKQMKFLIDLCPRAQQLTIDRLDEDMKSVVQLVLSKENGSTRHLFSLCIRHMLGGCTAILETCLNSENVSRNYSIKAHGTSGNGIYLWW